MQNERIKVLYIGGWGRSGTTLLDNILGQINAFTSVGELRFIWERGLIENVLCGCGQPFRDCPHWQPIMARAFGDLDQVDAARMARLCASETRTLRMPGLFLSRGGLGSPVGSNQYLDALARLYSAIRDVTCSRVIVDSSKYPLYASAVGQIPLVDLYIVHLVRDPRAVAYSWLMPKIHTDRSHRLYMEKVNPIKSSMLWDSWNLAFEHLGSLAPDRYRLIRYEDFVAHPKQSVLEILALLDENAQDLPFLSDSSVQLQTSHTVAGNPIRLTTGRIDIKLDTRWQTDLRPGVNALVGVMTLPLLKRYGYPFLVHKRPA
jgi:hypothetical protein